MLRLCLMILQSTPVIYAGCHAKSPANRVSNAVSWDLVSADRLAPIFISCSGCSLCMTCFSSGSLFWISWGRWPGVPSPWVGETSVYTGHRRRWLLIRSLYWIWLYCELLTVQPVARTVLHALTVYFISLGEGLQRIRLFIFLSLPSWLNSISGRCVVPSSHRLCRVKPTRSPPVGSFNSFFHDSGNCRKKCLYKMSMLLSLSM